jgi:hypothetical protein
MYMEALIICRKAKHVTIRKNRKITSMLIYLAVLAFILSLENYQFEAKSCTFIGRTI